MVTLQRPPLKGEEGKGSLWASEGQQCVPVCRGGTQVYLICGLLRLGILCGVCRAGRL